MEIRTPVSTTEVGVYRSSLRPYRIHPVRGGGRVVTKPADRSRTTRFAPQVLGNFEVWVLVASIVPGTTAVKYLTDMAKT